MADDQEEEGPTAYDDAIEAMLESVQTCAEYLTSAMKRGALGEVSAYANALRASTDSLATVEDIIFKTQ